VTSVTFADISNGKDLSPFLNRRITWAIFQSDGNTCSHKDLLNKLHNGFHSTFISVPSTFISVPSIFISVPSIFISVPSIFISVPSIFISVLSIFISVPSIFRSVPSRYIPYLEPE
jgi:hypothetical protein